MHIQVHVTHSLLKIFADFDLTSHTVQVHDVRVNRAVLSLILLLTKKEEEKNVIKLKKSIERRREGKSKVCRFYFILE